MIKTITYVTLFTVAGLIILCVASMWITFVLRNVRQNKEGVLNWSPFHMPDFVAINGFWTTPDALFCGALGIALVFISVGYHLKHVRRQEVGVQYYEQFEKMKDHAQGGDTPNHRSPSDPVVGGR